MHACAAVYAYFLGLEARCKETEEKRERQSDRTLIRCRAPKSVGVCQAANLSYLSSYFAVLIVNAQYSTLAGNRSNVAELIILVHHAVTT
ncbi:hypothetical protein BCV70DRAFT_44549 [Testicularia cyperi]|uniref:Uncharacterized protein n=1 Tax=Testicularia cyperi TaxID=1882483 RepID=A0A317XHM0_9BASI|nr:hypothetical protein BCV70DRAFT_44549 [Testicularia cyperi]